MLRQPAYLGWALHHQGKVGFDLATSGMPTLRLSELGAPDRLDGEDAARQLAEAIGKHNDVPAAEALGCLGASQGLWLTFAALVGSGDDVLVEQPAYEPILPAARAAGARVVPFDRGTARGYRLDPDEVGRALTPTTKVVAVTNLHNPSGVRADDEALRAVARMLAPRDATLFVDEVYAPFDAFVDGRGVFRGSARRLGPNVVVTSSLTKAYGLGPQRVGWVLGPERFIAAAREALVATVGVLPTPWMYRAVLALARADALALRSRELLGGKRRRVAAFMAKHPELEWSAPEAGLFGFARLRERTLDVLPLVERGAREHDVLVVPGTFFGVENGFRLAWSLAETKLDEALVRLERVLASA